MILGRALRIAMFPLVVFAVAQLATADTGRISTSLPTIGDGAGPQPGSIRPGDISLETLPALLGDAGTVFNDSLSTLANLGSLRFDHFGGMHYDGNAGGAAFAGSSAPVSPGAKWISR